MRVCQRTSIPGPNRDCPGETSGTLLPERGWHQGSHWSGPARWNPDSSKSNGRLPVRTEPELTVPPVQNRSALVADDSGAID